MLNSKIVKMLTLLMVVTPKIAHAGLVDVLQAQRMSVREVVDESDPDPEDTRDCFAMGELNIVFRTANSGPPNIGIVLTDPRGRRIGFDPLTNSAWQELPLAQGYIDCDDLDGPGTCRGIVEICGPVSGDYKLEVIGQQTTVYSLSVFARSKEVIDGDGLRSRNSEDDLNSIAIRERSRNSVLLNYSRDPQEQVSAQLQHRLYAQGSDSRSHGHAEVRASKK